VVNNKVGDLRRVRQPALAYNRSEVTEMYSCSPLASLLCQLDLPPGQTTRTSSVSRLSQRPRYEQTITYSWPHSRDTRDNSLPWERQLSPNIRYNRDIAEVCRLLSWAVNLLAGLYSLIPALEYSSGIQSVVLVAQASSPSSA
jgi:hypothetical protein